MERFLGPAEAARLLGVSSQTVIILADRGVLRIAAKTARGGRLFKADDVERLARNRERRADAKRAQRIRSHKTKTPTAASVGGLL
jgi:excisionase family DNA binding protein